MAPEAKWGWTPHGDSMISGPMGSQKDWGCLSVAELAGITARKPATETEPRSELSTQGHLELVTGWVSSECSQRPGTPE